MPNGGREAGRGRSSRPGVRRAILLAAWALALAIPGRAADYTAQRLRLSDQQSDDLLGWSVAVSGDTAAVGAPGDDDGGAESGSVVVHTRSGGTWTESAKVSNPYAGAGDRFGDRVALDGDTLLVAANSGVHVFLRADGTWTRRQLLVMPEAAYPDPGFGRSVALDGDTAVVGAPGAYTDGSFVGAAYVFTRADGAWALQQRLTCGPWDTERDFGVSVAIDGETVVVGADGHGFAYGGGAAFVFTRADGAWTLQQKLKAADAEDDDSDEFGISVAVDGDTAIVGAALDDAGGEDAGSVHLFRRSGGTWTLSRKLLSPEPGAYGQFGAAVALEGPMALVGAPFENDFNGASHILRRTGGLWTAIQELTTPEAISFSFLGIAVAFDGGTALAGATNAYDPYYLGVPGAAYAFAEFRPTLSIETDALPSGTTTAPYQAQVVCDFGVPPYAWSVVAGKLPSAGGLDPDTGAVDGVAGAPGDYSFTLRVIDSHGAVHQRGYDVVIHDLPALDPAPALVAALGRPFLGDLGWTGGTPGITASVAAGALPAGLSLDGDTGAIAGTPTAAGRFLPTVRVTDSLGAYGEAPVAVDVAPVLDLGAGPVRIASGERILRALELVRGTALTVQVRFPAGSLGAGALRVLSQTGVPLDLGDAVRQAKTSLQVRGFLVPATGRYFVEVVTPEGFAGEVALGVGVKAPKKSAGQGEVAGAGTFTATFSTLPGALATLQVKAAKGGAAVPAIVGVRDEEGNDLLVASELKEGKKSAVLTMKTPLPGGDLTVEFGARDGTAGAVLWTAKIKEPAAYGFSLPGVSSGNE